MTLGIVAAVGAAATGVWDQVHRGTGLARWDAPITSWAVAHRDPTVNLVARAVTDLAGSTGVLVLTSVLVLLLAWHRRWRLAVGVFVATTATAALGAVVKAATARPRPPVTDLLGLPSSSAAFPSGHTLSGTVLAGLVLLLAVMALRVRRSVIHALGAAAAALAAAIGASRVYLGYHWFTDVVAGWLLGAGIVAIAAMWLLGPAGLHPPTDAPRRGHRAAHPGA